MTNIKMKACAGAAAMIGAGEALASICLAGVVAAGWTAAGAGACACASNVGADAAGMRSWADPVAPVASAVGALHTCKCLRCVDGGIMIVWYDTGFPVWQMYLICPIMLLETSKPPESLEGILGLRHLWPTFLPVSMKWVWKFSIQHVLNVGQGLMESFQQMINFSTDALDMLHLQNNWAKSIRQEHRSKCISCPCCMRLTFQTKKSEYDFRNCWPLAHWPIGPLALGSNFFANLSTLWSMAFNFSLRSCQTRSIWKMWVKCVNTYCKVAHASFKSGSTEVFTWSKSWSFSVFSPTWNHCKSGKSTRQSGQENHAMRKHFGIC